MRYITQGEYAVGSHSDDVISTILGSCVSFCIWDQNAGVGGMNHLLFPDSGENDIEHSQGAIELEALIGEITQLGANRSALRAKIFGGASMLHGMTDIGARNVEFAMKYLKRTQLICESSSVGGEAARHVKFWPATGAVQQKFVREGPVIRLRGMNGAR